MARHAKGRVLWPVGLVIRQWTERPPKQPRPAASAGNLSSEEGHRSIGLRAVWYKMDTRQTTGRHTQDTHSG